MIEIMAMTGTLVMTIIEIIETIQVMTIEVITIMTGIMIKEMTGLITLMTVTAGYTGKTMIGIKP